MKLVKILFALFLFPFFAFGQRWEIGLAGGPAVYAGDLTPDYNVDLSLVQPVYGLFGRMHINPVWALRANAITGKLAGDETKLASPAWRKERGIKFTTNFQEIDLLFEYDPFGKKRFNGRKVRRFPAPYAFAGAGLLFFKPKTDFNDIGEPNPILSEESIAADRNAAFGSPAILLIAGGGLKMHLSRKITLCTEVGLRPALQNDYLDGVSKSGGPNNNDGYVFAAMTLSYRFLFKDTDADGIANRYDPCPLAPGPIELKGCPDEDGDLIPDHEDLCITVKGERSARGCPDMDHDGVQDSHDMCPETPGLLALQGCPDRDGDGLPDVRDTCPDVAGPLEFAGCPDSDLDSIPDYRDKCPNEGGKVGPDGCLIIDSDGDEVADEVDQCPSVKGIPALAGCPDDDGDGIADKDDACPGLAGLKELQGCPDCDGDGITDSKDSCPTLSGTIANNGCPELNATDKAALAQAVRGIEFENKSSSLKAASKPVLDEIAKILERYPNYRVEIAGHTDDVGSDKANLTLSTRRAKACLDYLISKSVDNKRLNAKGYGERKPIASNKTAAGRQKNRRVEISLIQPK